MPSTSTSTPAAADTAAGERVVTTRWSCHRRWVTVGTELSISGERGLFRFQRHVRTAAGVEWIDVISTRGGFRSFRPDKVAVVHRVQRGR